LLLCSSVQLLLCFHAIFYSFADECVGGGSLDVINVETPEVVLLLRRRLVAAGVIRVDDFLVGNSGIVAEPLKMLLVGGLEKLLSLGDLGVLVLQLAIFECGIGDVALLVEGIGPVVGGAVELSGHAIKLWIC
jgi:hypothetical protein